MKDKCIILKSYISSLGSGILKNIDYTKLKVCFIVENITDKEIADYDTSNDNLYSYISNALTYNAQSYKDTVNSKYESINAMYGDMIKHVKFKLLDTTKKTYNKDTLAEPINSYEMMHNKSVEEFVFNDSNASKHCQAKNSHNYSTAKSVYENGSTNDYDECVYNSFKIDFGISSEYRHADYTRLNIDETPVRENEIVIICSDLTYFEDGTSEDAVLNNGIYGFVLKYTITVGNDSYDIPIMLYKFAKPTFSNYNKIKLVFNANGLFGVT
jgi:hypothetical protein